MRIAVKLSVLAVLVAATTSLPLDARDAAPAFGPSLQSIGPLTFAPDGTLFAGDKQAATIFALDLGAQAAGRTPGTANVDGVDIRIASLLGTAPAEIAITDLAVHPRSRNSFVSVMRGQGADARPALIRIDGAGTLELVSLDTVTFTSIALPNPATANPSARNNPRASSITDLAFTNNRLFVAGLSNEEFASKLWSVAYPFATADAGTSVEIFHGNHDAIETRSPVMAFVPYAIDGQPHIIGGYTCTPLVTFPIASLAPGQKIRGTTIAELGAGNRPIDMIIYKKDGQDFLLMSNTSRGVMKIPTSPFASAQPITTAVRGTGGVPFETISTLTGIEQLDLLDGSRTVVIARTAQGRNLSAVPLP